MHSHVWHTLLKTGTRKKNKTTLSRLRKQSRPGSFTFKWWSWKQATTTVVWPKPVVCRGVVVNGGEWPQTSKGFLYAGRHAAKLTERLVLKDSYEWGGHTIEVFHWGCPWASTNLCLTRPTLSQNYGGKKVKISQLVWKQTQHWHVFSRIRWVGEYHKLFILHKSKQSMPQDN